MGLFIKGLSFFSHLRIISTWGGLKQALVDEALTVVELISQRKREREKDRKNWETKKKTRGNPIGF